MAVGFPRFRLYESNGTTLVYEFEYVTFVDDNKDPSRFIEHKVFRGHGSVIVPGSNDSWRLPMEFVLVGDDYEDLTSKIDTVKSSIQKFTKYILKVEKTSGGATQDYKVMRVDSFNFQTATSGRKRVKFQRVQLDLLVDCWV